MSCSIALASSINELLRVAWSHAAYEWGIVYGIIGGIIFAVLAYLLRVYYYLSDTIEKLKERIQKLETQNRALQSDDPVDKQVDAGKAAAEILERRNEER